MKEIFTDIYKKLAGFFHTEEKDDSSKNVACNRLKLVLMQDRTNLTPLLLERMRGEMIEVLSKYVEMDREALELNFEQEGEQMALMLSIPVLRAKEEDEIQAILDEEDAKKAQEEAESEEASEDETEEESEEDTDEDVADESEEETCSEESEEASQSPDEIDEEIEEETSSKKSKKKN